MIDCQGGGAFGVNVMRIHDEVRSTCKGLKENTRCDNSRVLTVRRVEVLELSAIAKAIQECDRQIELQTDRLVRQTKAGIDSSHSRTLLRIYHSSLAALERSREAMQMQQIYRSRFRAR
jgi:hypothetical protein